MGKRELPKLTDEDKAAITNLVYGEAAGASDDFKKMVIQTVLNRYISGRKEEFGDTFQDIINMPGQYAAVNDPLYAEAVSGKFKDDSSIASHASIKTFLESIVGDKDYGGGELFYFKQPEEDRIRASNEVRKSQGRPPEFNFDVVSPVRMVDDFKVYGYGGGKKSKPIVSDDVTRKKEFNNAFRNARRAGLKEFDWQGKRYTTELK